MTFLKAGTDWKLQDGKKVQFDKVSGMLNELDFEKAKDIIDMPKPLATYGLDKPKLEIALRQGSNDLARIQLGGDSKMPEGIYIKTADSPAVKVVSRDLFDRFNVKTEDVVEAPSAPPAEKPKP